METISQTLSSGARNYCLNDGSHTIFLNTRGKNKAEVSEGLVNFLEYVESGHCNTGTACRDNFINRLQKAVEDVIKSSEMEGRYMQFREILDEDYLKNAAAAKSIPEFESRINEKA